jgi:hypothetical protein
MSTTNGKSSESPSHFMVLDAVSRGISNVDKIARATKLQKDDVDLIVTDLLNQRLIVKNEKKGIVFRKKKVDLGITEIGIKLLDAKKQELEDKRQHMQQSFENGNGTELQNYMHANRIWIPMMLFSGIMDMMFFTSMMSFMGLGMNSMESAIIESDSVGGSGGYQDTDTSHDETHTVHDDHSGTSGEGDSGTSDGSDYGNSAYDSGSFDGFDGSFDNF